MTEKPYRRNVGVILFNGDGKVWLGHRFRGNSANNWQFPQGGVDDGEDLQEAAKRELLEETGIHSVEFLTKAADWISYDYPEELGHANKGQTQMWYAFRFVGDDSEVNLLYSDDQEFTTWEWADPETVLDRAVDFKRNTYRQVLEEFGYL